MTDSVYIIREENISKKELSHKAYEFVKNHFYKEFGTCNIEFSTDIKGKPYIKGYPHFHFNISHSGNLLAIAFSNNPVGVDIEILKEANLKIAQRYFTTEEKEYIKNSKDFLYVWTRKEALLKRDGKGIGDGISSHSVLNRTDIKTVSTNDYVFSVCSDNAENFVTIV